MNLGSFHWFPSNGMYSINRVCNLGCLLRISTNDPSSSSFTPRMTTELILTGSNTSVILKAALILSNTKWIPGLLVILSNLAGSSVSSEIFSLVTPFFAKCSNFLRSTIPFDVTPNVLTPSTLPITETISSKSFRTVGSPPVNRILFTPRATNRFVSRSISWMVSSFSDGVKGTPSSGMQYKQRRLHFSVSDKRRYVCSRP
mmetsp:Transcript_12185/g.20799  ORF Transcript_12185/g.20799 Transcript_12185/m.20799 type:complete len:201 (-) Transcript_12185:518-1120(-)